MDKSPLPAPVEMEERAVLLRMPQAEALALQEAVAAGRAVVTSGVAGDADALILRLAAQPDDHGVHEDGAGGGLQIADSEPIITMRRVRAAPFVSTLKPAPASTARSGAGGTGGAGSAARSKTGFFHGPRPF